MKCSLCGCDRAGTSPAEPCPRCALESALIEFPPAPDAGGDLPYELIQEIGRGSTGRVWLARDRALERLVAVKIANGDAAGPAAARLLREARAAARLRHPHIVRILAFGITGSEAWLAMDYVEGANLATFVRPRLKPRDAAVLVRKIAAALAFAHAEGVLHRDIKPSNILINDQGEPLLADFGLAAPLDGAGDLTRTSEIVGTPAYLAPEVFQGSARASVASDIYSLGAVLYFCLTGRPPFSAETPAGILELVSRTDPTSPRQFDPGIGRDLETICLKCLAKAPAGRYPTAAGLHDDLDRFIEGRPIMARPVSWVGKTVRFSRRSPARALALGLGTTVVLLLAIGGPLVALNLKRSRDAATTAANTALAITNFLQNDLLGQSSPSQQPDREIRLRTVLDTAAQRIDDRFGDRPTVRTALRNTLGETYFELGLYARAEEQFTKALGDELPAPAKPANPNSFLSLIEASSVDEIARSSRSSLADLVVTTNGMALCRSGEGRFHEAKSWVLASNRLARDGLGPDEIPTIRGLGTAAVIEANLGQMALAEEDSKEAVARALRVLGPTDPLTLHLMSDLGLYPMARGDYPAAAAQAEKVLALRRRISRDDNPENLVVMGNLGFIYMLVGRLDEAQTMLRQTLELRQRVSGPDNPVTLAVMANYALVLRAKGLYREAEDVDRNLVNNAQRVLGPGHPDVLRYLGHLGLVQMKLEQFVEAERTFREATAQSEKSFPSDWKTSLMQARLGEAVYRQHRLAEAQALLSSATAALSRQDAAIPAPNRPEVAHLIELSTVAGREATKRPVGLP